VIRDVLGLLRNLQVRLVPIDQLIPYIRNSRTHTDAQVALVAASIRELGWTNPILVRPDFVVIAGHARLLAARKLGLTEVPVIELSGLSEVQCRALAIADNQLAIIGAGWDEEMLRNELAALNAEDFDLSLVGFDTHELDELMLGAVVTT
jgi:ParB-like chromosome segregation protein Spo0J